MYSNKNKVKRKFNFIPMRDFGLFIILTLLAFSMSLFSQGSSTREIQPKPGSGKKPIKRSTSSFIPPAIKKEPFVKLPLPKSRGKEKYEAKVIANFSSILRYRFKILNPDAYPYALGIYEWGETGGIVAGPSDVTVDKDDNIYILDVENSWIRVYSNSGSYIKTIDIGKDLYGSSIYVDNEKNIYILDSHPQLFSYMKKCMPPHKEGFGPKGYNLYEIRKYSSKYNLIGRSCIWLSHSQCSKILPLKIYVDNNNQVYLGKANFGILQDKRELSIIETFAGRPIKIMGADFIFSYKQQSKGIEINLQNCNTKSAYTFTLPLSLDKLGHIDIIGVDKHANLYLHCGFGIKVKVIKVDTTGNILNEIGPFTEMGAFSRMKGKIIIDNEGQIYWFRYWASGHNVGGELVKFYRR